MAWTFTSSAACISGGRFAISGDRRPGGYAPGGGLRGARFRIDRKQAAAGVDFSRIEAAGRPDYRGLIHRADSDRPGGNGQYTHQISGDYGESDRGERSLRYQEN